MIFLQVFLLRSKEERVKRERAIRKLLIQWRNFLDGGFPGRFKARAFIGSVSVFHQLLVQKRPSVLTVFRAFMIFV